jgi:hypothetical protein
MNWGGEKPQRHKEHKEDKKNLCALCVFVVFPLPNSMVKNVRRLAIDKNYQLDLYLPYLVLA